MKKLILLIALWCGTQTLYGQKKMPNEKKFSDYTKNINDNAQIIFDEQKKEAAKLGTKDSIITSGNLFTEPTINNIFAKKMAYYLSGSNDVSTFKNYFTSSSKDKTVSIGYNRVGFEDNNSTDSLEDTKRISNILNLGIKGSLSTFFQEQKVQSDIGLNIGYTTLSRGIINFNKSEPKLLAIKRDHLMEFLTSEYDVELANFDRMNKELSDNPNFKQDFDVKRKAFIKTLYTKLRETFAEQEEKMSKYNFAKNRWTTFKIYIPFNTTKYELANQKATKIDTLDFCPVTGEITFSKFKQWQSEKSILKPSYLMSFTVALINDNSLRTLDIYGAISNRDTIAAQLGLKKVKVGDKTAYQGNNSSFFTFNLKPRILLNWRQSQIFSLDLFGDLSFSKYSHYDAGLGLLFSLPDKDGKKPINIEPTFTIRDIGNNLIQDKSWLDKLLVGVSISLPFNSLIF